MSEPLACPYDDTYRTPAQAEPSSSSGNEIVLKRVAARSFGKLLPQIVELGTSELPTMKRHPFTKSSWRKLRLDLNAHFTDAAQQVMTDPSNQAVLADLAEVQVQRRTQSPIVFGDPRKSLTGGLDTSVSSSVGLLQDIHAKTADFHGTEGYVDALHTSYRPLFKLAKGNPTQLIAIQHGAFGKGQLPDVAHTGRAFDYETPLMDTPVTRAMARAILIVSAPQPEAATVRQLTNAHEPTVGCPIMLTPEDVISIWQHTVMAADSREML